MCQPHAATRVPTAAAVLNCDLQPKCDDSVSHSASQSTMLTAYLCVVCVTVLCRNKHRDLLLWTKYSKPLKKKTTETPTTTTTRSVPKCLDETTNFSFAPMVDGSNHFIYRQTHNVRLRYHKISYNDRMSARARVSCLCILSLNQSFTNGDGAVGIRIRSIHTHTVK